MTNPMDLAIRFSQRWGRPVILLLLLLLAAGLRLWQLDQLPPGLFFDEAFNGVDVRAVSTGQAFPLYFLDNNGREPLFIYLAAFFVWVFGPTPYALRLCAAVIGVLTVPVIYYATMMLLDSEQTEQSPVQSNRAVNWPALIAATAIAVSFWHLSLSRLAFRVVLLPPLSALAIAYFWRSWQTQRQWYFGWAGFWLGVTLYTYIAARLLPVVLLLFVLSIAFVDLIHVRFRLRQWWFRWRVKMSGLLVMAGILIAVSSPLLYTIYREPALLAARTGDISIFTVSQKEMVGNPLDRLGTNLFKTTLAFYTEGDVNPRHNLPGRPFLNWPMALLFTLGWWHALRCIKQARMQLVLLWFGIMVTPTIFSIEAPHTLRTAGVLPPLALLIAIGSQSLLQQLRRISPGPLLGALLLTMIFGLSGWLTARDYFIRWATLPAVGVAFDVDLQLAATTVADKLPEIAQGQTLLLSRRLYLSPQMRFAVGEIARTDFPDEVAPVDLSAQAFMIEESVNPNQLAFLLQGDGNNVSALWLQTLPVQRQPLLSQLSNNAHDLIAAPLHQPGWPQLRYGEDSSGIPLQIISPIRYPLNVTFANGMQLLGYDIDEYAVGADPSVPSFLLTTFWQRPPQATPLDTDGFNLFSHLVFNDTQIQENGELGGGYPLSLWQAGQRFDDRRLFTLIDTKTTGKVYFETGLYRGTGDEIVRIDIVDGNGNIAGNQVILGATWVGKKQPTVDLAAFTPLHVHFAERIELVGWQWAPPTTDSEQLQVALVWRAIDRVTTDYTAFIHLLTDAQEIVTQGDQPPGGIDNPTSLWAPGEVNVTYAQLPIKSNSELENAKIRVGLYEQVSGLQLSVTEAGNTGVLPENTTYILLDLKARSTQQE